MTQARDAIARRIQAPFVDRPVNTRSRQRRSDYREYYTAGTRELVARHFLAEIERFAYAFD
jgi:hypothetical protein